MIRVARYRLDFVVGKSLRLPAFAGSTLRGVFGRALRASVCVTGKTDCDGCPLLASCPYAAIFEPRPSAGCNFFQEFSQIPRPYVIEPPEWGEKHYVPGERLSLHLVLAGRALDQLPLILWAFHKALSQGVGKGDGTAALVQVAHVVDGHETVILDGPSGKIAEHDTSVPSAPVTGDAVTLRFNSPLRLQNQGRRATADEYTPRRLLMALVRRIALMCEFHGDGPLPLAFKVLDKQADALGSQKCLQWRDWTRYSSRQQQKMVLGGAVGTWRLTGDLTPFLPFLQLGEWLHVGKETTFGLGGYRLEIET